MDCVVFKTRDRQQLYFNAETTQEGEQDSFISNVVETRPGLRNSVFLLRISDAEFGGDPEGKPTFTFHNFIHPVDPAQPQK